VVEEFSMTERRGDSLDTAGRTDRLLEICLFVVQMAGIGAVETGVGKSASAICANARMYEEDMSCFFQSVFK
jgi:hypothetical protein